MAVEEMAERLAQTEQLVTQLKEMIREKDAALRSKDDQLKVRTNFQLSLQGSPAIRVSNRSKCQLKGNTRQTNFSVKLMLDIM